MDCVCLSLFVFFVHWTSKLQKFRRAAGVLALSVGFVLGLSTFLPSWMAAESLDFFLELRILLCVAAGPVFSSASTFLGGQLVFPLSAFLFGVCYNVDATGAAVTFFLFLRAAAHVVDPVVVSCDGQFPRRSSCFFGSFSILLRFLVGAARGFHCCGWSV